MNQATANSTIEAMSKFDWAAALDAQRAAEELDWAAVLDTQRAAEEFDWAAVLDAQRAAEEFDWAAVLDAQRAAEEFDWAAVLDTQRAREEFGWAAVLDTQRAAGSSAPPTSDAIAGSTRQVSDRISEVAIRAVRSAAPTPVVQIDGQLTVLLRRHDLDWAMAFEGAVAALEGCGPDHPRHVAASLRAVLFHAIGRYVSPRPGDSQQQKLRHLTGSTKEARLINETL